MRRSYEAWVWVQVLELYVVAGWMGQIRWEQQQEKRQGWGYYVQLAWVEPAGRGKAELDPLRCFQCKWAELLIPLGISNRPRKAETR